ncbi:alpha/beta hydrolase family protein [Cystobacter fuscus]|uniref:alpha/beta hydrolase family protein n=1 Tax=Cystobacter fuscus TaxID=43 RepID=UPI0037C17993
MVLAALAFHPGAFDVGVDVFGISDWVSTLKELPPYWESGRQSLYSELGNPETQEEMLRAISPLFHTGDIRAPLLVIISSASAFARNSSPPAPLGRSPWPQGARSLPAALASRFGPNLVRQESIWSPKASRASSLGVGSAHSGG